MSVRCTTTLIGALPALALLALSGCDDFRPPAPPQTPVPAGAASMDAGLAQPPPPPFVMPTPKVDGDARLTHAQIGDAHVFIPDAVDHAVTVVALADGSAREVRAGVRPDLLAVAPGRDLAVVLDTRGANAHVIEVDAREIAHSVLPTIEGANAIAFTPDGHHAIVHFDPALRLAAGEVPQHERLTHLDLRDEPVATDVDMGFAPRAILLGASPPRAYLQRDARLARIDLASPDDGAEPIDMGVQSAHVEVFAEHGLALSYREGELSVTVVDLEANARQTLWLQQLQGLDADAGVPEADGTVAAATLETDGQHVAIAVTEHDALLRVRFRDLGDAPNAVERFDLELGGPQRLLPGDEGRLVLIGGRRGEAGPHSITLWSPLPGAPPLRHILPSPAGDTRVLLGGEAAVVSHDDGYTIVSGRASGALFRKAEGPPMDVLAVRDTVFAIAPEHARGAEGPSTTDAAVDDGTVHASPSVDRVGLDELEPERVHVDDPPRSLDATPDGSVVLIDQDHPAGRFTIVDLEAGTRRTLTGFHVNDRVKE